MCLVSASKNLKSMLSLQFQVYLTKWFHVIRKLIKKCALQHCIDIQFQSNRIESNQLLYLALLSLNLLPVSFNSLSDSETHCKDRIQTTLNESCNLSNLKSKNSEFIFNCAVRFIFIAD